MAGTRKDSVPPTRSARAPGQSRHNGAQGDRARSDNSLEAALGQVVREFRKRAQLGIADLARRAGLSPGMLSKIENGAISPSLSSIRTLARALQVPVTSLFREFDDVSDATFVRAGEGMVIHRTGMAIEHDYRVLGHATAKGISVEPYMMSYGKDARVIPFLRRTGTQFIYILEGALTYRQGKRLFEMSEGDSLLFQADVPHGPEEFRRTPVRYLSVLSFLGGMGG